jgi:hypothetical protein
MSTPRKAPKKPYVRRSSALRGKPLSSMPVNRDNIHSLYIEIASLQMTRARHEKVREALAQQVRRSEEAILEAEQGITILLERIALAEGARERLTPHAVRTESASAGSKNNFLYDY